MRPAQQNRHAKQATVVTFIFSPPNWREATTANTTATELGDYSKIWCNPPPIRTQKIQDGKEKKWNAWCMSVEGMLKIPFDWYITATIPYFPYKSLHFERTMLMLIYILSLGYLWFYSNHLRIISGNHNGYSCQNLAYIFLIICIKHCLCQLLVYEEKYDLRLLPAWVVHVVLRYKMLPKKRGLSKHVQSCRILTPEPRNLISFVKFLKINTLISLTDQISAVINN